MIEDKISNKKGEITNKVNCFLWSFFISTLHLKKKEEIIFLSKMLKFCNLG